MEYIPYFGYGTNRDHDMMAAMIGRDSLEGAKGIVRDYELVIQGLEHIPDKILPTAPAPKSPREIMGSSLSADARLYIIRPKKGAVTYGTIWQITPKEYEIVRDWELLDFGMQEDMKVEAETETGEKMIAQTHGSTDPNLPIIETVEGPDYEDYLVPKDMILSVARQVNKEFLDNTEWQKPNN